MSVKGLERAIQNLNSLSRLIVPEATAKALNRVASRTISQGSKTVAKEAKVDDNRKTGLPVRLVRQRSRLRKARHDRPVASIKINRGNLPAIKLGTARVRLSRKKGARNGSGSVLKIGPYTFRNAFIQQLENGRWQVMRRVGQAR
ncbi:TPA: phage tail protein, partial [Citrobacter freundii]